MTHKICLPLKINYNEVENVPNSYTGKELYNGNISETYWRTNSDNVERKYGYFYDDLNRLTSAIYQKPGSATAVVSHSYNENLSYDKNGNISGLYRYGDLDTDTFVIKIDDLVYSYDADKKNQLVRVVDNEMHPEGFKDDIVGGIPDTTDDYTYDDNGNMIADQNKGIINIKYNHLNLPYDIVFTDPNKKIKYLYDATGRKVRKLVSDGTDTTVTDYVNGYQYEPLIQMRAYSNFSLMPKAISMSL